MERNQIDHVDMRAIADRCRIDNVSYKYVLLVIDVFSQYLFLKPLHSKSLEEIAAFLEETSDPPTSYSRTKGLSLRAQFKF